MEYISCTSLNQNLAMLSNSGVNINDSIQVKNHLNIYYNAQFSYFAYKQVISNCATFAGSYVLPRKGTEADFVESAYRYAFNGKEQDPEGMGGGGSTYDYGFRIYNPNLGRFLSVDPLANEYPWYTPYQFAGNNPIVFIDRDGLEPSLSPKRTFVLNKVTYELTFESTTKVVIIATNARGSVFKGTFAIPNEGNISPFEHNSLEIKNKQVIDQLNQPLVLQFAGQKDKDPTVVLENKNGQPIKTADVINEFLKSKKNNNEIQLNITGTSNNPDGLKDERGNPYKPEQTNPVEKKQSWLVRRAEIIKERLFGKESNPNIITGGEKSDTEAQGVKIEFILPNNTLNQEE